MSVSGLANLVVSKPDTTLDHPKVEDVVNEWFALWVVVWSTERLKTNQQNIYYNIMVRTTSELP